MLCELSLPVAESFDGGLKCFVMDSVKVNGLKGLGCLLAALWLPSGLMLSFGCPMLWMLFKCFTAMFLNI